MTTSYDLIFGGIILFSTIIALVRGGIGEILALCTWIAAFWLLPVFAPQIDKFVPNNITNHLFRSVIVFIIIFTIIAIAVGILKKLLYKMINLVGLSSLNYLIGIIFGIIRGIFICALLVIVIEIFNFDSAKRWKDSQIYPIIYPVINWINHALPNTSKYIPKG